jgi:hypothetical protein
MPRRRLGFPSLVFALALASCISPEELRREDEATCSRYGFHPGTWFYRATLVLRKRNYARYGDARHDPAYYSDPNPDRRTADLAV